MTDKECRDNEFSRIFKMYNNIVLKIASNTIQDYHFAQEIAQDAYLKLYLNWPEGRTDEEIKAWLIVVTKRIAIDYQRKRSREVLGYGKNHDHALESYFKDELNNKQSKLNPEYYRIAKEADVRVAEAILSLKNSYRDAIIYTAILDIPQDEACRLLNINKNLLRVHIFRAREELRNLFGMEIEEILHR